ncbi:hypothetical protein LCGC14_2619410, partial [marine sediment metagenome]
DYPFLHPTWASGRKLRRDLWYHFLHSCRGVIAWDNHEPKNKLIDRKTLKLTARGEASAPVLKEILAGTDRMLIQSRREDNGVAIYHSPASARVNWWHQFVNVGRGYILRQSWHEYRQDERSVLRTSWIKLIEDNHLQFAFVSPAQLAEGRLAAGGFRVLLLPEVWALSDAEAGRIAAFARAGGTVIADQYTGLYDGHGRRRAKGALDELFGIDQSAVTGDIRTARDPKTPKPRTLGKAASIPGLKADTWDALATRGPNARSVRRVADDADNLVGDRGDAAFVVRTVGKGKAVFLNLDVSHYSRVRTTKLAQAEAVLSIVRAALPAEVQPPARILSAKSGKRLPGSEVAVWTAGPRRRALAVWRNYNVSKEGIGGERFTDNSMFEKDERIVVELDRKYHVVNQRTGKAHGLTDRVALTLSPWEPIILTLQDVPPTALKVTGPASAKRGEVVTLAISGPED